MILRPISPADHAEVLRLNAQSVHYLSPLTASGLEALQAQAALHRVVADEHGICGFLITLAQGADYGSPNYRWFADRHAHFLYVDRIVVSSETRTHGAGSLLYGQVFDYARDHDFPIVCCEFDVEPPNPASERFHRKFGFAEVGRQSVAAGSKIVSLQMARAPFRQGS
jgi:predicted GNAT superfamily acetyltransferase